MSKKAETKSTKPKKVPITATVPVISASSEEAPVETRTVTIEIADATGPAIVTIALASKDEAGNWRPEVRMPILRRVDQPDAATPEEQEAGTLLCDFILSARVDPKDPLADRFGVKNNEPLYQGLPTVVHGLLTGDQTGEQK